MKLYKKSENNALCLDKKNEGLLNGVLSSNFLILCEIYIKNKLNKDEKKENKDEKSVEGEKQKAINIIFEEDIQTLHILDSPIKKENKQMKLFIKKAKNNRKDMLYLDDLKALDMIIHDDITYKYFYFYLIKNYFTSKESNFVKNPNGDVYDKTASQIYKTLKLEKKSGDNLDITKLKKLLTYEMLFKYTYKDIKRAPSKKRKKTKRMKMDIKLVYWKHAQMSSFILYSLATLTKIRNISRNP